MCLMLTNENSGFMFDVFDVSDSSQFEEEKSLIANVPFKRVKEYSKEEAIKVFQELLDDKISEVSLCRAALLLSEVSQCVLVHLFLGRIPLLCLRVCVRSLLLTTPPLPLLLCRRRCRRGRDGTISCLASLTTPDTPLSSVWTRGNHCATY